MFVIISRDQCNFCDLAKVLLKSSGLEYKEYNVQQNRWLLNLFKAAGFSTVPQIYDPDGIHIGGHKEFVDYLKTKA